MAANIAKLRVQRKVSDLRIQQPDSLFGVEAQIERIERGLRRYGDAERRENLYDLEDVIDEMSIRSFQRRNRDAFIRYLSAFVDLPKQMFYVLAIVDLINLYKLEKKLKEFKCIYDYLARIKKGEPNAAALSGKGEPHATWQWQSSYPQINLNLGSTFISPVISKLSALAFQKQFSPALRKQAKWLLDEFSFLQDYVQRVDSRQVSEEAMVWIEELCDVCRSAENVVGLFIDVQQLKQKEGIIPFKNLVWAPRNFMSRHKLAKKMGMMKAKLQYVSETRSRATVLPKSRSDHVESISKQKREHLPAERLDTVSFGKDADDITERLLKDDPRCLTMSIMGISGLGKTSLAKLIFFSKAIVDHFPYRFWVSGANSIEQILVSIGADINFEHNDTLEDYEDDLRERVIALLEGKKCLIVVDDSDEIGLWIWMCIKKRLGDISNGTRIIFTVGHRKKAPPVSETNDTYRLHLRSDEESWALFNHALKKNIPTELEDKLKNNIVRKCGGLAKVIVKLGELLSQCEATEEQWSRVLDQLIQDEGPWSQVLQDINQLLPLYLRRCLFHLGLFPANYKIPARRLFALWIAEGLREESGNNSPEYVAEMCLRELVNCNLVQMTEKKLNDYIKKCCLPGGLRLHWFTKVKETNNRIGVTRYLADHLDQNGAIFDHIHGKKTTYLYSSCYKDMISFISFDTREESKAGEDIGNFLDRCISSDCFLFLWVLDLECVYKPKLPKAIGQLTVLRYLGLRWTYLDILPEFIGKLLNLETLDLKGTCIKTLPSLIWDMRKLRHLFLNESNFHSMFVPRKEDDSLVNLQTLRGLCVDEDSPVRNGLDTLSKITKLGLKSKISLPSQKEAMSSQVAAVANWVMNLKHLQYLQLKSLDESCQPWDLPLESLSGHMNLTNIYLVGKLKNQHLISEFPKNLMELTLCGSRLAVDPMQTLDKLPNLRILVLLLRSFIGKQMVCSFGGFPKLEVLRFKKLELLEEWNVEEGALSSLKVLEIESCNNLEILPDGLRHVKMLRELKLTQVPLLSSRIKDVKGEDREKIAHVRHVCTENNPKHNSNQNENKGI